MVKADWKNISRRPLLVFGFTVLTPMIFAAPTQAADYDAGSIHITAPWARATPKGASSGADDYEQWQHTGSGQLKICRRVVAQVKQRPRRGRQPAL
jgi:hypothetical protein